MFAPFLFAMLLIDFINFRWGVFMIMIIKTVLILVGIVLGSVYCLFGNDENVSSKKANHLTAATQKAESRISGDIERPLLRQVVLKKEEAALDLNSQKAEQSPSASKKEEGVEHLLALLRAEKENLQEMENKYNKMRNILPAEPDGAKNNNEASEKTTRAMPVAEKHLSQSLKAPAESNASEETANKDSIQKETKVEGGATAQSSVMNNNNTPEAAAKMTRNPRLEMILKNVSQMDVAECYYKLCEYENALRMYKLFAQNNGSSDQYVWAQYQVANCYRNLKKYDSALSEYQQFVSQFPDSDLTGQAKWYMEDIGWWKAWHEKNTLANKQVLTVSNNHISR